MRWEYLIVTSDDTGWEARSTWTRGDAPTISNGQSNLDARAASLTRVPAFDMQREDGFGHDRGFLMTAITETVWQRVMIRAEWGACN